MEWQIPNDLVESPLNEGAEFFHLVPPTRGKINHESQSFLAQSYAQPYLQEGYHLRPERHPKSRALSIASTDSVTTNGWDALGSDSSTEGEGTGRGQMELSGNGTSIDPNLVRGDVGCTNHTELALRENVVDDEPKTARPIYAKAKSPKSPPGKKDRKKVSHARKQGPEHIPRPRNAFILFRKHVVDSKLIPHSVEMRHQNVSVIVAKMWSEASPDQKAHFNQLAKIEKEEHMRKYPGYRYQPVYRRTNVIRRRVRKDDAEEEKCKSVAELLMKGKSGEALEHEIKEKIRKTSMTRNVAAANELSKGALRALRAQARQNSSPSVDWSDLSACPSRANSMEADRGADRSVGQDIAQQLRNEGYVFDNDGYLENYEWSLESGTAVFENDMDKRIPVQQTYAYPQDEMSSYSYAQPQAMLHRSVPTDMPVTSDFYAFDHALPFSPTASTSFSSQMSSGMGTTQVMSSLSLDTVASLAGPSGEVLLGMPYPSPTSGLYGAGPPIRLSQQPMSARWDRAHQLLPPSSEVQLDALGFENFNAGVMGSLDDDLLLADFGAALAQADEPW